MTPWHLLQTFRHRCEAHDQGHKPCRQTKSPLAHGLKGLEITLNPSQLGTASLARRVRVWPHERAQTVRLSLSIALTQFFIKLGNRSHVASTLSGLAACSQNLVSFVWKLVDWSGHNAPFINDTHASLAAPIWQNGSYHSCARSPR